MIDYSRYYRAYAEMKDLLEGDYAKMYLTSVMADQDKDEDVLTGNMSNRVIDMDWVLKFEDCVPYIEKAIDEQRKFIVEYNQVDRIDKIKQVRKDSITHLTQHTNLIQSIDPDGSVIPEKLLNTLREDSFATYENRFLYTLIFKSISFIEARFRALQNAPNDSEAHVSFDRELQLNKQKLSFNFKYDFESHERDKVNKEEELESLTDYERILRLRMKLDDFVNTDLIQQLKGCIQVKSPINKTNCIKQDPAFKKCYELWTFIESYLKPGYVLEVDEFDGKMPQSMKKEVYDLMAYEHFVMLMNTNPALKEKLNAEYLADKKRREEEANKPEEEMQRYIEDKIYEARREEMALRLQEVREREMQISKLMSELEEERARVKELQKRVDELQALVAQREKELEQARNELRLAQAYCIKLENTITLLQEKNAKLEEYIKQLEVQYNEQANAIRNLNSILDEKVAKIEELILENNNLKNEIVSHKQTIQDRDSTIAQHESTIAQHAAAITATNAKFDLLSNEHNELISTHNDLINKYSNVEEQFKNYEETISKFDAEKEEMSHTIRVNENMLSAKDAIINTVKEEKESLQQRVDTFDSYHDELKKKSDAILDKYEARETELVGLTNTIKSQSAAMAKHQDDLKSMSEQVAKANAEKEESIKNLIDKHQEEMDKVKHDYEDRIKKLEQQVVDACHFNDEQKYLVRLEAEKRAIKADYDKKLNEATIKAKKFVKKARVLANDYPEKLLNIDGVEDYKD